MADSSTLPIQPLVALIHKRLSVHFFFEFMIFWLYGHWESILVYITFYDESFTSQGHNYLHAFDFIERQKYNYYDNFWGPLWKSTLYAIFLPLIVKFSELWDIKTSKKLGDWFKDLVSKTVGYSSFKLLKEENVDIKKQNSDLTKNLDNRREEVKDLKSQVSSQKEQLTELTEKINLLENENANLKSNSNVIEEGEPSIVEKYKLDLDKNEDFRNS